MSGIGTAVLLTQLWAAAGASTQGAEAPAPPSVALLEFLGRYEDAEGEWIDPLTIGELPTDQPIVETNDGEPREDTDDDVTLDDQPPGAAAGGDGAR